jgi:hypothetical protein
VNEGKDKSSEGQRYDDSPSDDELNVFEDDVMVVDDVSGFEVYESDKSLLDRPNELDDTIPPSHPFPPSSVVSSDDVTNQAHSRPVRDTRAAGRKAGANQKAGQRAENEQEEAVASDNEKHKEKRVKRNPRVRPSIFHSHFDIGYVSPVLAGKLQNDVIDHIPLASGNLTKEGYHPFRDSPNRNEHIYTEWKVDAGPTTSQDFIYNRESGHVEIRKPGIYYIYSQIFYNNVAVRSGFVIMSTTRSQVSQVSDKELAKCMTSVMLPRDDRPANPEHKTCYTAVVAKLTRGQTVYVKDLYSTVLRNQPSANFFGLFNIAEG